MSTSWFRYLAYNYNTCSKKPVIFGAKADTSMGKIKIATFLKKTCNVKKTG